MAFTQADLDQLDRMIANGITESETADGKRVRFASIKQLKEARSFIKAQLRGTRKTTIGYASFEAENEEE